MKFINNIKLVLVALAAVIFVTSCNDDLAEINVNPNQPTTVEPQFLLTNTIYEFGNQTATNGFEYTGAIMQYHGKFDFNYLDQYRIDANTGLWNNNYRLLADLNDILNSEKSNEATKAAAKIIKAMVGSQLTDLYGPVPFFEAGDKNNLTPKYDQQEAIYTAENGILDLLSQAASTLKTDNSVVLGDILFNGDKEMWVKLANSLQIKYLVRVGDVYPSAKGKLAAIVNQGEIFSMGENAILPYSAEPNNWFLSKVRSGDFAFYNITTTVHDMFMDANDPRIAFHYRTNDAGKYVPITSGSNDRSGNYTGLSTNYRAADIIGMVFETYFDQEFNLAEAVMKGYISGSAKTHYDNAVKAAFAHKNVAMPSDYLTNPAKAQFNETLEQIINQKYLANILIGHEAWFDYRRTGYPNLTPALNNINNDKIPVRFKYPVEETFSNTANYNEAVSNLGANNYDSKSWWDK